MEKFWEDFRTIIEQRDALSDIGFKAIKQQYETNKANLLEHFDKKGRIKTTITDTEIPSESTVIEIVDKIINQHFTKLYQKQRMNLQYGHEYLRRYIRNVLLETNLHELATNKLITDRILVDGSILTKGAKLSKWYSHLPRIKPYPSLQPYKDNIKVIMDTIYSLVRTEFMAKENSELILSINPVDFLLASANTTGWRSCHNFIDGEYKTGWLSYMLDEVSLTAFGYKREDYFKNSSLKYPVKEWRQMVFVDLKNRSAVFGRQYPGNNIAYAKTTRKLTGYLLADIFNIPKKWWLSRSNENVIENTEEVIPFNSHITYGEFNYSDPITTAIKMKEGGNYPDITLGSREIPCFSCGDLRDTLTNCYYCESCDSSTYCAHCNGLITGEIYTVGNEILCEDCFDEYCVYCNHCDTAIYSDEAVYLEDSEEYLCKDCFDRLGVYCSHCDKAIYSDDAVYLEDENKHLCEDCFDEAGVYCAKCNKAVSKEEAIYLRDSNEYLCEDCFDEAGVYCAKCNKAVSKEEAIYLRDSNEYLCEDCFNNTSELPMTKVTGF